MARDLKQQDEEVRAADAASRPAVFDWSNVRSAMAQVQSSSTSAARSFGRFLRRAAEAATSAASGFLEGGALPSDRARTALETLRSELTTQPRWDHQVSREYLERLWNFAFGNAAVAQESERWQTLGFVTRDPTADMEESGLLGLKSFVYGAERYPDAVRRMLEEHKTGEDDRLLVGLTAFLLARVLAEVRVLIHLVQKNDCTYGNEELWLEFCCCWVSHATVDCVAPERATRVHTESVLQAV